MTYRLTVIGRVVSPVTQPVDEGWAAVVSRVVLLPQFRPGLRGLSEFSHVVIVAWLHGASFDAGRHLVRRPRGLASLPEVGIFAQRAKDRPNPLGISVVPIVEIREDGLVVRGLDAIDGTPVVDIKPYFPHYDRAENARVPAWVDDLMTGYFE